MGWLCPLPSFAYVQTHGQANKPHRYSMILVNMIVQQPWACTHSFWHDCRKIMEHPHVFRLSVCSLRAWGLQCLQAVALICLQGWISARGVEKVKDQIEQTRLGIWSTWMLRPELQHLHRFECAISYPVGRFIADTSVVDEHILQGGDSKRLCNLLILKAGFMIPISLCCIMRQSRQTFASILVTYIYICL